MPSADADAMGCCQSIPLEALLDFPMQPSCKAQKSAFSSGFATPWTVANQAPTSMGFSRQEYWSGLPFSSPGDLANPGIEPGRLV